MHAAPDCAALTQVDPAEAPYLYYMMNQQRVGVRAYVRAGVGGSLRLCVRAFCSRPVQLATSNRPWAAAALTAWTALQSAGR